VTFFVNRHAFTPFIQVVSCYSINIWCLCCLYSNVVFICVIWLRRIVSLWSWISECVTANSTNVTVAMRIPMAYLGSISEFSSTQVSWTSYVKHLVQYLRLRMQTNSEQYSLASVVQQLIGWFGTWFQRSPLNPNLQILWRLYKSTMILNPLLSSTLMITFWKAQFHINM